VGLYLARGSEGSRIPKAPREKLGLNQSWKEGKLESAFNRLKGDLISQTLSKFGLGPLSAMLHFVVKAREKGIRFRVSGLTQLLL